MGLHNKRTIQIDNISTRGYHTYLLPNGKTYTTGRNNYSQLRLNDTKSRQLFTPLTIKKPVDAKKLYNGPNNGCRRTYYKILNVG